MNRVELQNGCLTRAHSSLFIPSTIHGSCVAESGKIDSNILNKNLDTVDIYIDRCDGCSCGNTQIHLFKGQPSDQVTRKVRIFLKGSKKQKEALKVQNPELYSHFSKSIRERHMVRNLPQQYIFFLKCCFYRDCTHPVCKTATRQISHWYSGGPLLSFFPLPVADATRCWGTHCEDCKGPCHGHYLKPEKNLVNLLSLAPSSISTPPSSVIADAFKLCNKMSDTQLEELAKKTLLSLDEVNMYIEHLADVQRHRKGARKAAETRAKKKRLKESTIACSSNAAEDVEIVVCVVSFGRSRRKK